MTRPFVIRPFDFISAVLIAFLLGGLSVGWFGIALDVYTCQFATGWDEMINFDKWRAE